MQLCVQRFMVLILRPDLGAVLTERCRSGGLRCRIRELARSASSGVCVLG